MTGAIMKNLYVILIAVIFCSIMSGCIETKYIHKQFSATTGKLTDEVRVSNFKANVNDSKEGIVAKLFDGTSFGVDKIVTTADPNSAIAEGQAISNVLSAGAGSLIKVGK